MSMYTQLLDAAWQQRPARGGVSERAAIDDVLCCHGELAEGLGVERNTPPRTTPSR